MIRNLVKLFNKPVSLLVITFAVGLAGCGGGGGGGGSSATSQGISGGGVKGPLANAVVTVYSFDASQPRFKSATSVATGSTNSSAAITGLALPFPLLPPYIMEFTSTPGTTVDITTGAFPVITTMRTVITQSLLDSGEQIYATPLTTMAVDIAITNSNSSTTAAEFEAALTTAASQVVSTLGFGMDSSIDIFDTPPLVDSTTDTTEEQTAVAAYRAAVEAVTAIAYEIDQQTVGGDTDSVLTELAADLADGGIDGSAGSEININTLQVLQQDPALLTIPNTAQTVAEVQAILATETAITGSTTTTTELTDGSITTESAPAETNPDIDGDGVLNADDAFPENAAETVDTDGDGIGDNADPDDDNNGILDVDEGTTPAPTATDTDGDGILDSAPDNCINDFNPSQTNTDGDTQGDACDTDDDEDGTLDINDAFPLDAGETTDTDSDGTGDVADTDDDNDGVLDGSDTGFAPVGAPSVGVACSLLSDCDGDGVFDSADFNPVDATVTFNFAPVANDDTAIAAEDAAIFTIDVTANDTDDDGNPNDSVTLTAIGTNDTAIGAASINANNIDYTPAAEASGVDTFTYTVSDGEVTSTASVTVTITAVNDAPTFTSTEVIAVNEDAAYSYTAVANDVDTADNSTLSAPTLPAWLSFDAGTLTGTPDNSNVGVHAVVIRVNDGTVDVDQSFNITVANTPDAPVFTSTAVLSVNEDSVYTYTAAATDVDAGASLTLSAPTLPTWLTFAPGTGVLTGMPTNTEVGTHNVTLRVTDSITTPVDQSFTITVVNTNDAPTFTTTAVTAVDEDSSYSYDANVNDVDPGPDALILSTLGLPSWLSFDAGTGILSGTPLNADVGVDNITIRVNDGTVNVDQTFAITIANTNDAPVVGGDTATVGVDTSTQINVFSNDDDEDVGDSLTISSVTQSTEAGSSVVNNTTSVTYVAGSSAGTDSFTYTVTDAGGVSRTATVDVTITIDTPPAFTSTPVTTATQDSEYAYSFTATDTDDDTVALTVISAPAWITGGNVAAPAPTTVSGSIVGTPTNDDVGDHSVTIRASANGVDVDQIFTITVANTNDAPTIDSALPSTNLVEGDAFSYTVAASDIDVGDNVAFTISSLPAWLSFDAGTGALTSTSAAVIGSYPVTITATDDSTDAPSVLTDTQSFTVVVSASGMSIPMTTLLGTTEGGAGALGSYDNGTGAIEYEYWTDTYDVGTQTFEWNDYVFNSLMGAFEADGSDTDVALDGSGFWVNEGGVRVVTADNGDGSMTIGIRDEADTVDVEQVKLSARYVDIATQPIADYLDAQWQSAMFDSAAVFGASAKLISSYTYEMVTDGYLMYSGNWCQTDDPSRYATLNTTSTNTNCNGVDVPAFIDASGFATSLSQLEVAAPFVDNDDFSTPDVAVTFGWEGSLNLRVEFAPGPVNVANYYVVDWSGDATTTASLVATGTYTRDTTVQGVDMIRFIPPVAAYTQFPEVMQESTGYLVAMEGGYARLGDYILAGSVSSEMDTMLNGHALDDILANFSGDNFTTARLSSQSLYDVYLDTDLREFLTDVYNFNANGTFTTCDYQDCGPSTENGNWDVTANGELHLTMTSGIDIGAEWWMKVVGVNPDNGVAVTCATETLIATATGGVYNCTPLDVGSYFGFAHQDEATAVGVMNYLNTADPQLDIPLKNFDGTRPAVTGTWGAQFDAASLVGTHTFALADESMTLSFNADYTTNPDSTVSGGTGTIKFPPSADNGFDPNDVNPIFWEIDINGVLRFTENESFEDQWFWVIGYFDTAVPGNVLVQITTPTGQVDSADYFVMGGFDQTLAQFPDAATLAATTYYTGYLCSDGDGCTVGDWVMEAMTFDAIGNYTLVNVDSSGTVIGTPEEGTYTVTNGVLHIISSCCDEYISIIGVDTTNGALLTCWEGAAVNSCTEVSPMFENDLTAAASYQASVSFTPGATPDAATLLAGDGIYEFWDDEWDGSQEVPAYWNVSLNTGTVVDQGGIWTTALNSYVIQANTEIDYVLASTGWVEVQDVVDEIVTSTNSFIAKTLVPGTSTVLDQWTLSLEAMDITGVEQALYAPVLGDQTAVFSSGAKLVRATINHDMNRVELRHYPVNEHWACDSVNYALWNNNCNVVWLRAIDGSNNVAGNLDPVVALTDFVGVSSQTVELGSDYGNGNLVGVFVGDMTSGIINLYTTDFIGPATSVGTGSYTIVTENSAVIIDYTLPAGFEYSYGLQYDAEEGETGIMSVHNGFLRHGERESSGVAGILMMLNSVAANDVFNNLPAVPAIYGTWIPSDYVDTTTAPNIVTFLADGNYMHSGTCDDPVLSGTLVTGGLLGPEAGITGAAPELGPYTWNSTTGDFTVNPIVDANYWCGLNDTSNGNNFGNITVSGDVMTLTNADTSSLTLNRVTSATSPVVGSWLLADVDDPMLLTIFANGTYNESQTCMDHETGAIPEPIAGGMEYGTYTWDEGNTYVFSGDVIIDTDGWCGIHDTNDAPATAAGGFTVTIDGDVMTAVIPGEPDVHFYRIQ